MATFTPSPIDKLISRTHLSWQWFVTILILILLGFAFATAYFDGFMDEFLNEGVWRRLLLAPAIVIYIVALQTPLGRYKLRAVETFRKLVRLDDESFNNIVREASDVDDRVELIAFCVGAAFGFVANGPWQVEGDYVWLKIYSPLTGALMFGLMSWIIVASLVNTKLQSTLHKLPLEIDIFDLQLFEPIGLHSLFVALAFVGGSAISMIFVNPLRGGINIPTLVIYGIFAVVSVLVFFLDMRPTHRVLAEAKAQELAEVRRNIAKVFRALNICKAEGGNFGDVATELNLWLQYEEQLKVARTWPYNTGMLRTLFVSVLLPAIVSVAQRILGSFFP